MYCSKCGARLNGSAEFCHICGAKISSAAPKYDFSQFTNTADTTTDYDIIDIAQNKAVSVVAYLGWLVLIPIFTAKNSPFARFHSNQGLVLWLLSIIWGIVESVASFILTSISTYLRPVASLLGIVNLVFIVLMIIGIVNAAKGRAKELPIIGGIRFIK